MGLGNCISSVVAFLRAGYPAGAPAGGYVPLLALLPRRVSDDEITAITSKLLEEQRHSSSSADIGVEVTRVTGEMPSPDDIARVQRRLAAASESGR
jgi:hypothetical protein